MHAAYAQSMPAGYTIATHSKLNSVEQIRQLVNLLMVFSMLSSMMSPLYTPANSTTPSFAFPGEVRAPAPRPSTTAPVETQALPPAVANVSDQPQSELSGVLTPDWLNKALQDSAGLAGITAATPATEIALPSNWEMFDASNALQPKLATLESDAMLGSALTPAWYEGLGNEENTSTFADASETAPAGLFSPNFEAAFYQTGGDNQCSACLLYTSRCV